MGIFVGEIRRARTVLAVLVPYFRYHGPRTSALGRAIA